MARPRNPEVDDAIVATTLELLTEQGFAAMTIEAVAQRAGVGKPAIYRRFPDKASLVAATIRTQLREMEAPDLGDTKAELALAFERGLPPDGPGYLRLIGGLVAEEERHPELIEAFRQHILNPRRAIARTLIERGQARGDVRAQIDAEAALDALVGPFLARAFAGLDVGTKWRQGWFESWWKSIEERKRK